MERCERTLSKVPHFELSDYECRNFPLRTQDKCEGEKKIFCAAWTSARYFTEWGIWFSAAALVALLFGISTHSRRRRVWRAVAGLVLLHGATSFMTRTGLLAHVYSLSQLASSCSRSCSLRSYTIGKGSLPLSMQCPVSHVCQACAFVLKRVRTGFGFILNAMSWLFGFAVAYGVIYTGMAADRGYRWAAGNRFYYPIRG